MSEIYPKYFYKYRSIKMQDDLSKDYAIDALLNNFFIFSSRLNFNDLFDSKVELVKPTANDLKRIISSNKAARREIGEFVKKGKITPEGDEFILKFEKEFNKLIDSYGFLSLSSNPVSNLMWSHYADSHKGICIEYKSEFVSADKVFYENEIPKLNIYEVIRQKYLPEYREDLGLRIWSALRTKLKEWEYESEYRYKANNFMGKIPEGEKYLKVFMKKDLWSLLYLDAGRVNQLKTLLLIRWGRVLSINKLLLGKVASK